MKDLNNISNHSIFGEYDGTENRVTAALLHIVSVGGEPLLRYLLGAANELLPDSEIRIGTQVGYQDGRKSVYDGVIMCDFRFRYIIESKVVKGGLGRDQVEKYHANIDGEDDAHLLAITPDDNMPKTLLPGDLWMDWTTVVETLRSYNDEEQSDLLRYLIDQFVLLLSNLNLYDKDWQDRVIIVGGSFGEPVAKEYGFYACQNNRFFRRAAYLAFAHKNRIENLFRIIDGPKNDTDIKAEGLAPQEYFNKIEPNYKGDLREYFKLEWVQELGIDNNNTDKNGRRCAFVQRQTYTTYDKIINAKVTSEL